MEYSKYRKAFQMMPGGHRYGGGGASVCISISPFSNDLSLGEKKSAVFISAGFSIKSRSMWFMANIQLQVRKHWPIPPAALSLPNTALHLNMSGLLTLPRSLFQLWVFLTLPQNSSISFHCYQEWIYIFILYQLSVLSVRYIQVFILHLDSNLVL